MWAFASRSPGRAPARPGSAVHASPTRRFAAESARDRRAGLGRLGPLMGIFDRFLRAGEGKKLRALEALVPDISALEPELERLSDDALQAKTGEFRERL